MIRKTSLMEWLDQTKKLSKSTDYIAMEVIDNILNSLWLIDKKVIVSHKKFFNTLCDKYHKPNPLDFVKSRKKTEQLFEERNGIPLKQWIVKLVSKQRGCKSSKDFFACAMNRFGVKTFSEYVDNSIMRCEKMQKEILWQWFEVIDFMYERPELINPNLIDEYIEISINEVCADNKKNNPLTNGMKARFGKFWKGPDGKWHPEKRVRF
jgi:hypothetical protein